MTSNEINLRHNDLLLLTGTSSTSFSLLRNAYGAAVTAALSTLSSSVRGSKHTAILDVTIAVPSLGAVDGQPRGRIFNRLQELLANFYRLTGVVSVKEAIELDGPGGVDVRVFFIAYDRTKAITTQNDDASLTQIGPITNLQSLAASGRSWESIYSLDTTEGDGFLRSFTEAMTTISPATGTFKLRKVPSAAVEEPSLPVPQESDAGNPPNYSVAVGGTFDHLHLGHKLLLAATALALDPCSHQSEPKRRVLTVGITGDELLVNKKYAEVLESWEDRWRGVWTFLQSIVDFSSKGQRDVRFDRTSDPGPNGKSVIVSLDNDLEVRFVQIADPFGPTITDRDITALVVSKETRSGGKAVNDEREKKGWPKLEVFEVDVLELDESKMDGGHNSPESFESKISSTEIRRRRINLAKGSL